MRFTACFLLAMVCLNAVHCVSLRKNSDGVKTSFAIERLRFIGKKSSIAKQIVAAVELHLTSGGRVEEVIALVQQALDDVSHQRDELVVEYGQRRTELEEAIASAKVELENNQNRLAVVNQNIDRLNTEIANLVVLISNLETELANLETREQLVEEARAVDVKTYAERKKRDTNSLEVLEIIIQKLQALYARGPVFLQVSKKEISRSLGRILKSNPIPALVQLSTKFDPETLSTVISKLQGIQQAIQASYIQDRNGEESSKAHYEALIAEIHQLRAQAQANLAQAQSDKASAEGELAQFQQEQGELVHLIQLGEEFIATTSRQLEITIASFESRIAEAGEAVVAISTALEVLNQNVSQLQGREQSSDDINAFKEEYPEWSSAPAL